MKRRDFLQCAAILAAGATAVPAGWVMSAEQKVFLAAQDNYIDRHPSTFFTALQRATVTAVAEQVIPVTDTPGATDAGVPRFIELMVSDWFTDAERNVFMNGLSELEQRAEGIFSEASPASQLTLLETLEGEAGDAPWYKIGNTLRVWDESAPFICQFKELTVLGFLLSEVGANSFLRVNPMGSFDGDVPLATDSTYATLTPFRNLAERSANE